MLSSVVDLNVDAPLHTACVSLLASSRLMHSESIRLLSANQKLMRVNTKDPAVNLA